MGLAAAGRTRSDARRRVFKFERRAKSGLISTSRVPPERGIAGVPTQGGGLVSRRVGVDMPSLPGWKLQSAFFRSHSHLTDSGSHPDLRPLRGAFPVARRPGMAALSRVWSAGAAVVINRPLLSNYTDLICYACVKWLFFCGSIVAICRKAVEKRPPGTYAPQIGAGCGRPRPLQARTAASERLFQRVRCKRALQTSIDRPAASTLRGGRSGDAVCLNCSLGD